MRRAHQGSRVAPCANAQRFDAKKKPPTTWAAPKFPRRDDLPGFETHTEVFASDPCGRSVSPARSVDQAGWLPQLRLPETTSSAAWAHGFRATGVIVSARCGFRSAAFPARLSASRIAPPTPMRRSQRPGFRFDAEASPLPPVRFRLGVCAGLPGVRRTPRTTCASRPVYRRRL